MTHVLKISDGTTTVTLTNSANSILQDYVQGTPGVDVTDVVSALRHGGEIGRANLRNVTESVRTFIVGASGAVVQTNVQTIEKLLRQAEMRARTGLGRAVYVHVQMDSDSAEWRSEILTGRLELMDGTWALWSNKQAEVVISWTRRYFWEAANASNMPLASSGTARTTGGVTVTNDPDINYINIIASDVAGVLPSPLALTLRNNSGGTLSYSEVWIGQYVEQGAFDSTGTIYVYEGEASLGGGTNQADANSNSGDMRRVTWVGAISDNVLFYWQDIQPWLTYHGGRYFRLLARFATAPTGTIYLKARVRIPIATAAATLYESPEVLLNGNRLQDIGVVQLPPSLAKTLGTGVGPDTVELALVGRSGATGQLELDYVQLLPMDGYRHIQAVGNPTWLANERIVDDGIIGALYQADTGDAALPTLTGDGMPIHVWPGCNQRLILAHRVGSAMTITQTWGVTATYRPRRLTL